MFNPASALRLGCACAWLAGAAVGAPGASVELTVLEAADSSPLPSRIHLENSAGQPVKPRGLPAWRDHFVCAGRVTLDLAPGVYRFVVERGPEYSSSSRRFEVAEAPLRLTNRLARLAHLAREGWWSGETHVHRPLQDIELLMCAEDLHVAGVQTWWNNVNPWQTNPLPSNSLVRFDGDRFYDVMSGEDERGGGALLYFGLKGPLPIAGSKREHPSAAKFLKEARQHERVWVDVEKPFWWDAPVWLASGLVDSVGIAHNHMHRGGVLDNEAWGRTRDRAKYPGAHGNGLWTQDIYYHLLNCGLRIPPSAGSASGVLPNPVGYNRAYVHLDGGLTYEKWWQGLRAGRVFVSNGPLLRCRANGQWPGHVFKSNGPLQIQLQAQLDSRDPIKAVELVHNGRVDRVALPQTITVNESGWFLVRAIADATNTFRFASTGPWYVEIGSQPSPVRRESAQFFVDWLHERMAALRLNDPQQRAEVMQPLREAEQFWQSKLAQAPTTTEITGEVVDAATGQVIPSRIYVQRQDGRWFFPESAAPAGSAIRYERRNWVNTNSVEFHTTLSAHPFRVELEPGTYTVTAERGKEYRPLIQRVEVGAAPVTLRLPLHRWVNMAARGWYSGDTHVHRTPAELSNVMQAEDLNVAFPLTYWVTKGFAPPTQGDKNTDAGVGNRLVEVDATHVFWPRNTEYEIFTIGNKRHTLGAVFALGHRTPFTNGAPPAGPIAEQARREGALLDLDKHDWPWSMALVPLLGVDLYELANNHHWRTEFAMTNWSTPAPAWMGLPNNGRSGNALDWTRYTFQNYYALLDCGFRLRATAGTANGVHPVPLGFGRVYVHLPGGFSYDGWLKGLNEGRSFVTTGPMLLAKVKTNEVSGLVLSEEAVREVEVVINGEARHLLTLRGEKNADGAWEARFRQPLKLDGTSWVAVRCFERGVNRPVRFAHTAPRWFDVPGSPLRPRKQEIEFLMQRVRDEINRSRGVLPTSALAEYERALAAYESLLTLLVEPRPPTDDDLRYWLENMTVFHRFTPEEVSAATGLSPAEVSVTLDKFNLAGKAVPRRAPGEPLRVLPYPGGRHPRSGFFEGAVLPQRETKFSVFTPWDDASYAVVDVPEAIFSNLGLTYLAHTHIATLWDQQGLKLPPLEWNRHPDGTLTAERTLPNGIAFGTRVVPAADAVRMELWLRNGTPDKLAGLRVQNCVMLKAATGFATPTLTNKVFQTPYAAVRSGDGRRWIITAWEPCDRCWGNERVPCLHADPKFPDCPAGETVRLRGWLSFYEGADLDGELKRIEQTGWREKPRR
ncbi:MAG: CehA/McbA family metallohydrolase [Verrucomicrobia bacterium]|nr:CehA/McbA family metallohydrolase [Verrucomicrobiota bacterium]